VARRKSNGVLRAWAEAQRRQQRQREAQERAWHAEQERIARAQRVALRTQARDQREALRAYQQGRETDAAARTSKLDAQVTRLDSILENVLAAPPFQPERLMQDLAVRPFAPGPLAVPVPMPDQRAYQIQPPPRMTLRSLGAEAQEKRPPGFPRNHQLQPMRGLGVAHGY
jgi:restriction system protein